MGSSDSEDSGFLDGILAWVKSIGSGLKEILLFIKEGIFDKLFELAKKIWVPEDGYFKEKFNHLLDLMKKKSGFNVSAFNNLNVSSKGPDPIYFDWNGKKYLFTDFSFLINHIEYVRTSLSFLLYFLLYLFGLNSFLKVVRGYSFINPSKGGSE